MSVNLEGLRDKIHEFVMGIDEGTNVELGVAVLTLGVQMLVIDTLDPEDRAPRRAARAAMIDASTSISDFALFTCRKYQEELATLPKRTGKKR